MNQRIKSLIFKEFLAALKDKKTRFVLIIPPIIQLLIFTFAATLDVKNVPIGILNRDHGEKGFELVESFQGSPMFTKIVHLNEMEEVTPFIDNQEGLMVLSIDEQFSRNIDAKKPGTVQLILDGRRSNSAQIVSGYTSQIIQQFNQDLGIQQSSVLVPRNWFNPNLLYYWYNIPCLVGVLTTLVALVVTAMSVAREREMGTFDQLLISPLRPIEILIGKAIPAIVISLLEGAIIALVGIFVFSVPFTGNILVLYLSIFVFVCSIVGVGLFISALSATQQQAILGTFVFMSPAVSLSGFATPIENMPSWLQTLTYANPLRYMILISKGVFLKAMPLGIVLEHLWPLAIIAICTLTAATLFFRARLQ